MTDRPERSPLASEDFANTTYDASRMNLSAASGGGGGLATGPRDTVSGRVVETPAEPMERPGTESAEEAERAEGGGSAIDAPRLTPQGRTGEDASDADETDPMGGVKIGQRDKAEG